MANLKVLISHSHNEQPYAEAWKGLLDSISAGGIEVWYSSDLAAEGGMPTGKEWRESLYDKLEQSNFIIAIQTLTSAGRPWIMWECGAASGINKERGLIPVVYGMGTGDLANPLNSYQVYQGEDKAQVMRVCNMLLQAGAQKLNEQFFEFAFTQYLASLKSHPPRKPVNAEQMALWRTRFEELINAGRYTELLAKRSAMYAALSKPFTPVAPSVHELLSKVLLDHKYYKEAIEEVDYALSLCADDIELLHRKALALVEDGKSPEAEEIIQKIFDEHPELQQNPELASLEGRINRERWQSSQDKQYLNRAFDAYLRAYRADQTQYYPGINAGSLALAKGDEPTATEIFSSVLQTCEDLQQRHDVSFWVDFTTGDVLLGMGKVQEAMESYRRGLNRKPAPLPRHRTTALKGTLRMASYRKLGDDVVRELELLFRPE